MIQKTMLREPITQQVPFVSIVMPVRNEAACMERALCSVLAQDYPRERMELLVVDGCSEDATRQIVLRVMMQKPPILIRLLDNPQCVIPAALNIGIRAAQGAVIIRMDGHTLIPPDYVALGVATLRRTGADNVGGLAVSHGDGWIGETIALAERLRFGLGGGLFRRATHETEADTVYMGVFRRDVFDRVGLFDEAMVRNQDIELNGRIRRAGGRIVLSPSIRATYFCRTSLHALWKQSYANGLWLFPTTSKTPGALSIRHFTPLAFVAALIGSAVASIATRLGRRLFALIAVGYLIATTIATASAAARHGWRFAASLPLVFGTLHVGYGMGSLVGLYRMIQRRITNSIMSR